MRSPQCGRFKEIAYVVAAGDARAAKMAPEASIELMDEEVVSTTEGLIVLLRSANAVYAAGGLLFTVFGYGLFKLWKRLGSTESDDLEPLV